MRDALSRGVWNQLGGLLVFGAAGHLSDEELLGRFVARRDAAAEAAFAALVERHGPMVLGNTVNLLQIADLNRLVVTANCPDDQVPALEALRVNDRRRSARVAGATSAAELSGPIAGSMKSSKHWGR